MMMTMMMLMLLMMMKHDCYLDNGEEDLIWYTSSLFNVAPNWIFAHLKMHCQCSVLNFALQCTFFDTFSK